MRYTLADVKASYGPEKAWAEMQGDLPCYLIYRPISFWMALPFLWLGVPVLVMTGFSLLIALALPAVAIWGGEQAYLGVAGLGFLYHVMDCVDGNMARTLGRTSRLGAILDGTIDMSFWCLLLLSLGLLVEGQGGGIWACRFALPGTRRAPASESAGTRQFQPPESGRHVFSQRDPRTAQPDGSTSHGRGGPRVRLRLRDRPGRLAWWPRSGFAGNCDLRGPDVRRRDRAHPGSGCSPGSGSSESRPSLSERNQARLRL